MSWFLKKLKSQGKEDSEKFMMMNGARVLEKLISSSKGKYNPIRSFSAKELKTATNNYDTQKVIKNGISSKLYEGFFQNRPISLMKFETAHLATEKCINCIVFASQMSHKNVLKLIGCCLETETPIPVFESVASGSLAYRIHGPRPDRFEPLPLGNRLKIAMEIANAIAYAHAGFARPIVITNITSSNILFDEQCVAKLFDFSQSETIPEDKTHIRLSYSSGTLGFVAPEYCALQEFNEKCDVYSFGASLLELLTGKKLYDCERNPDQPLLEDWVKKRIENNRFVEIMDPIVVGIQPGQGKVQQLQILVELALKCLSESEEDRPEIMDVAKQLRQISRSI